MTAKNSALSIVAIGMSRAATILRVCGMHNIFADVAGITSARYLSRSPPSARTVNAVAKRNISANELHPCINHVGIGFRNGNRAEMEDTDCLSNNGSPDTSVGDNSAGHRAHVIGMGLAGDAGNSKGLGHHEMGRSDAISWRRIVLDQSLYCLYCSKQRRHNLLLVIFLFLFLLRVGTGGCGN